MRVDHEAAVRRNPHRTRTEAATIAIPTVMKPAVTTVSCHGRAPWPPVIGERLAAPSTAASVVTAQLTYLPYNAPQYTPALSAADSLTSTQIAPNATRKIPFMTPSRWAASPIRGLVKCCSISPVSKPNRNRNIPCHIKRRLLFSTPIIVPPNIFYTSSSVPVPQRHRPDKRNPTSRGIASRIKRLGRNTAPLILRIDHTHLPRFQIQNIADLYVVGLASHF